MDKSPKAFISYSHDSEEHRASVLNLCARLRADGVECEIDQYHEPPEGWPTWMLKMLRWADQILIVCTKEYCNRFERLRKGSKGKGVKWEGAIITQGLYESEGRNERYIPIVFERKDLDFIPAVLRSVTHYEVGDGDGYDLLYRRITCQPTIVKNSVGEIRQMKKTHPVVPQRSMPPTEADEPFNLGGWSSVASVENDGGNEKGIATAIGTFGVELTIKRDFDSYTEDEQQTLLEAIKRLLELDDDIHIVRKRKGSVILTIELDARSVERLKWAVEGGELREYGVVATRSIGPITQHRRRSAVRKTQGVADDDNGRSFDQRNVDLEGKDAQIAEILSELEAALGAKRYALWIDGKISLSTCKDTLTVGVANPLLLTWMQKQFKDIITAAARVVLGDSVKVTFVVDKLLKTSQGGSHIVSEGGPLIVSQGVPPKQTGGVRTPVSSTQSSTHQQSVSNSKRRLAELKDFIAGSQTELALTAVRQIASGEPTKFNPLYLHGPVGTGKTHLLEGLCRQLQRNRPMANVMLLTSESFANSFTQALRDRTLATFRQQFRNVDALLVDDIEFFESKRVFQEEFLHTFTELIDHGRLVVLTGSRHPRLLTKLGDELATRFLSGLVCRLDLPDTATRRLIVQAKAARMTGEFAPEALDYIAGRFQGSIRELEGALNCLQTYHSMTNKRVMLSAARQILADLERDCFRIVRLADIERVICNVFGVKPTDLQSESRVRTVAQPRMLAMFLARRHTQSAYSEIGQHFGGRNHSTVMSAERKVQQWVDENCELQVASQTWTISEILSTIEQQLLA